MKEEKPGVVVVFWPKPNPRLGCVDPKVGVENEFIVFPNPPNVLADVPNPIVGAVVAAVLNEKPVLGAPIKNEE